MVCFRFMTSIVHPTQSLQKACYQALMAQDPTEKCKLTLALSQKFNQNFLEIDHKPPEQISVPGRPKKPKLVLPKHLKKRGIATQTGRNHLMHAVAHIEFNAINLALDAVYRFANQPRQFYVEWLRVAEEEAKHFKLVSQYLKSNSIAYGDFPAHDGLWDMCLRTSEDILARMALVPRVLEARGLDVTPSLIEKLIQAKDDKAADVLQLIYEEEIDHVRIGSDWFVYHCHQRKLEPKNTFLYYVKKYLHGELRGPFNLTARQKAGFTEVELKYLQDHY